MKKLVALVLLPLFNLCSLEAIIRNEFVQEIETPFGTEIELYVKKPDLEQYPLVIFLHGASNENGIREIPRKIFDQWTKKGYAVAAISLPGFGYSYGPKDFCGPLTINSLQFAIEYIMEQLDVNTYSLIGFGQGAIASLLLASKRSDVCCVVAANAIYNLENFQGSELFKSLKEKNYSFDTSKKEAMDIRNVLKQCHNITAEVFILERIDQQERDTGALEFHKILSDQGKRCQIKFVPKSRFGTGLFTYKEVFLETEEWLDNIVN